MSSSVSVKTDGVVLEGDMSIPANALGIVLFAHGSGSSRMSPRNRFVAEALNKKGVATLLFDLLTSEEEDLDVYTASFRFDIDLLSRRLAGATEWVAGNRISSGLKIGYFGASTGAAAALVAAAQRPAQVKALVSRGGRPDLAGEMLENVKCPTLLIVGGLVEAVIELNQRALAVLKPEKKLVIVPGATHLFDEEGTLEEVACHASEWFLKYLGAQRKNV